MKLYTFFRSSAAYRVRIGLNIKGIAFESIPVHLRRGEHRSESYTQLNPQRLVPTLLDGPRAVSQSLAILEYLDETQPDPPLLPQRNDSAGRALVRAMALSIACDIHPLNNVRVLEYLKGPLQRSSEAVDIWYRHWVAEGFDALEELARRFSATGQFLYQNRLSLADICLVPQVYNARRFQCDLTRYPTLTSICAHLETLPEFAAGVPEAQPDAETL